MIDRTDAFVVVIALVLDLAIFATFYISARHGFDTSEALAVGVGVVASLSHPHWYTRGDR